MVIIKALLFLAAFLVFLFLIVLIIPFSYSFSAVLKDEVFLDVEFKWSLIHGSMSMKDWSPRIDISIMGRTIRLGKAEKKIREKTVKKKKEGRFGKPGIAFLREALSFVREVFDVLKPKEMWARGAYGLEDPAYTAVLQSVVLMISSCLPRANVAVYPVFESEMRDVEVKIAGRIVPVLLVWIMIKYLLKKEVRRVIFLKHTNAGTQNINI